MKKRARPGYFSVHCAHTALVDPASLEPNPLNPKRHSQKKLALYGKIIRQGGWRRAIVVSARSGLIVSGHGAWLAATQVLKVNRVPVDRQEFESEEAETAAMLADNWLAESMAEYDQNLIAEIVSDLREGGFDLELAGILSDPEIGNELETLAVPPVPRMAWVLIGVPVPKFGQINALVEKAARIEGARVETAANNQDGEENGQS